MDTKNTQYLYKEIRLNLEPSSSVSVVNIKVPPPSGTSRKLPITDKSGNDDENAFRSKNLANASTIFHRKYHSTPSSFLWRVLEDGTVLSVRATDVAKNEKGADAPLILNFRFATKIQSSCIAFADPREHDALCMFVLDDANVLYSFTLRPDYFRKRSAIEAGPAEACRVLIPFQGKSPIWHGKVNMDLSAATSLQVTDLGIEGASFLFTVCLDHRMRIWNLHTGQILFTGDVLNAERNPQEVGKWTVDPAQSNLLQIVGQTVGARICATYSPIGQGEFKLWTLRAHDAETIYVEDSFPDVHLVPSAPSMSDVWTLADFSMLGNSDGGIQLWALWKNNMTYRVQELDLDQDHVDECWKNNWTSVFIDTTTEPAPTSGPCDSTDVTDKWLNLILSPGKFTRNTLEAALSIYERGLGAAKDGGSRSQRGLAESICSVIASTASLDRKSSGGMDYEQFRSSSEIQWRRFHRLLLELDKQRGEAISLSVEPRSGFAWVVCADSLSAIRECSSLERLCHNFSRPDEGSEDVAKLISTGLGFLDAFPDSMVQVCAAALSPEIFEETSRTDYERLQYVWDTTGFWRSISEDDCSQVIENFGQQFALVTESLYGEIFDLLSTGNDARHRNIQHPLTDFGRRLIVKAVQETVELQWRICLSQLLLLVHMEFDWEREEDMLSKRLDVGSVFRQYLSSLRRLELIRWLATTEVTIPLQSRPERAGSFSGISPVASRKKEEDNQVITALEGNVGHLLGFPSVNDTPLAASITSIVTSLCAADSDIEVSPALIQCSLIRRERADLANGLGPFCDQTPFAVYVQGRVALALKDYDSAAISFRRATVGMSVRDESLDRHSSGLLDDAEWNLLHKGPAKYYCHIVSLFDRIKAYSFVLEFAGLALQFARSSEDSETVQREMLNRQFVAATATSRFDVAHSSLLAMDDRAMRHNSLSRLVDKMCTHYYNEELMSLPFPGLQDHIDEILASKCKATMEVTSGVPYHQILYSWRINHNDYRGAASVLMDRIQKLKHAGEGDKYQGDDVLDTPVTKQYLLLINALSCVDAKQAWIFSEELPPQNSRDTSGFQAKRKVVTLTDLRKQYQDELDRIAAIQNNQFEFEAGDEVMDIL
ncbi:hypothetical protein ACHAQH_004569 [Verticillium albo-atrum]